MKANPLPRVLLPLCLLVMTGFHGCRNSLLQPLEPRDFLLPPRILDSRQEFGLLETLNAVVPAKASIFLAKAEETDFIDHPSGTRRDTVPLESPVEVLKGVIEGGETLDIFATGNARNVPVPSVNFGPNGGASKIATGPALRYYSVEGPMGALVGVFDNDRRPFVIGQRKQIRVPRGATSLILGVLDYPGYSSDNEGEYNVSIDVIRR